VRGNAVAIRAALRSLANAETEPIFGVIHGKRPPVYVWDETRPPLDSGMEI